MTAWTASPNENEPAKRHCWDGASWAERRQEGGRNSPLPRETYASATLTVGDFEMPKYGRFFILWPPLSFTRVDHAVAVFDAQGVIRAPFRRHPRGVSPCSERLLSFPESTLNPSCPPASIKRNSCGPLQWLSTAVPSLRALRILGVLSVAVVDACSPPCPCSQMVNPPTALPATPPLPPPRPPGRAGF